jgi:hypothetical protein
MTPYSDRVQSRLSVEVERPRRWDVVGFFLGTFQCLLELLFQKSVTVFHGCDLALENLLRLELVPVQVLEQGVEVLASRRWLLHLPVGKHLSSRGIDDQMGLAFGASEGKVSWLGHLSLLF